MFVRRVGASPLWRSVATSAITVVIVAAIAALIEDGGAPVDPSRATDDAGGAPPGASLAVAAPADGGVRAAVDRDDGGPAEPAGGGAAAAGTVSGTVFAADGSPLPGAVVELRAVGGSGSAEQTVVAGGDGGFRFDGARHAVWTVRAAMTGHAPAEATALPGDRLTMVLAPGRSFGGIVVDDGNGLPLPGATVVAWFRDSSVRAVTDGGGRFAFADCPLGQAALQVAAPGYGTRLLEDLGPGSTEPRDPVVIRLRAGGPLRAVVRDAATGAPVSGAAIDAVVAGRTGPNAIDFSAPLARRPLAMTDESGRFDVAHVGRTGVRLSISAAGYARREVSVPPGDEPRPHEIELHAAVVLTGVVVDGDGHGVAGAEVRLLHDVVPPVTCDGAGRFSVAGLAGDVRVILFASHPGHATAATAPFAPDAIDGPVEIVLGDVAAIGGLVRDDRGEPAAGALIWLEPRGPNALSVDPGGRIRGTGPHGRFTFDELPPGSYGLRARTAGALAEPLEVHLASGGLQEVTLTLRPYPRLRGRVLDQDGRPVAGARVTAGPAGDGRGWARSLGGRQWIEPAGFGVASWFRGSVAAASSDARGRFELPALQVGQSVRVVTERAGFARADLIVELGRGDVSVTVQAEPPDSRAR